MLDHARMKAADLTLDQLPIEADTAITQARMAWHHAAQTRYRQTAFPAVFQFAAERRQLGIDQDGFGHRVGIRIARIGRGRVAITEDHHAQADAYLWRGETGAVGVVHGVEHVGDQRADLRRTRLGNRLRYLQQARIAHAQNVSNHRAVLLSLCAQSIDQRRPCDTPVAA